MNNKYIISENHKTNQVENNIKNKDLIKKQNSFGKLYLTKRMNFSNYLLNKQLKNTNIKKSNSYHKNKMLPHINIIKNAKIDEKKSIPITYYQTFDIQMQDPNEKEKLIAELCSLQNDMYAQDEELNMLYTLYNKLQDNNLTNKIVIEKILCINDTSDNNNDDNNVDNNNDNSNNEVNSNIKNGKMSIKDKRINLLKLQIKNYDKNIEKQKIFLSETKKEKNITNFITMNKLINNKNKELEQLIIGSQKLQYCQKDMDTKYDFLNFSINKYKDNNYNLKLKIELNKKEKKINDQQIQIITKEIEDVHKKLDKLETELDSILQSKKEKKDKLDKLKTEYRKSGELQKEKEKIENDLNMYCSKIEESKKILEKNDTKINMIKKENNELKNDISIMKEENNILNEKGKQN